MIPSLIVISLAFTWLLYESNWMRVRLPVGAMAQVEQIKTVRLNYIMDEMYSKHYGFSNEFGSCGKYEQCLIFQDSSSYYDKAQRMYLAVGLTEPVCGWDWILNHEHPIIENHIEILAHNCKHTITLCDNPEVDYGRIMKDVCQVAFKPNIRRRNGHKPNKRRARLTFNPNYGGVLCQS